MFITLSKIERGGFNEDTGLEAETHKPCVVNVATIRCFYARREDKPGTRITFTDGGGFAVAETPDHVGSLVNPN